MVGEASLPPVPSLLLKSFSHYPQEGDGDGE